MANIQNVLVTQKNPKSPVSEAYRVLRTNIQFTGIDKPLKAIVVTSAGPFEGKTTTVVNLAITFAQMGSRVLLIDADMRKPKVHKVFGLNNSRGLTNFLVNHDNYKEYLRNSPVANLDILTSGIIPPNPSELLLSKAMEQFMKQAGEEYDMVLLDSPPVVNVTDAAVLSALVDGTILVVASGKVERKGVIRAKELLSKVNANIIGVVLNKLSKKSKDSYHSLYVYYGENGQEKQSRKKARKRSEIPDPAFDLKEERFFVR